MQMPPAVETEMPAAPAGAGELTIPKADFDRIHTMVKDLASALDAFSASQEVAAEGEMPAMEEEVAGDEADLAAFAQELSSRTKV